VGIEGLPFPTGEVNMGWLRDWLTGTPRYQGKNLREWVLELQDTADTTMIMKAFHTMGPQAAVPALIKLLVDRDPWVPTGVWHVLGELSLVGPTAQVAVPALLKLLGNRDERIREEAAVVLGRAGSAAQVAVPALLKLLGDEHHNVRSAATEALKRIGLTGEAVPALIKLLADRDEHARMGAADLLGCIAPAVPATEAAVPALIKSLFQKP
jgi:HEAT repeat protein